MKSSSSVIYRKAHPNCFYFNRSCRYVLMNILKKKILHLQRWNFVLSVFMELFRGSWSVRSSCIPFHLPWFQSFIKVLTVIFFAISVPYCLTLTYGLIFYCSTDPVSKETQSFRDLISVLFVTAETIARRLNPEVNEK